MIAYMISSVIDRRMKRSSDMPSYREKSSGVPNRTVGEMILLRILPGGAIRSVPITAHGITGTCARRASRATPVRPL